MYAILRTEKMKTGGKISVSLDHNNRQRECLAADPNLEHQNEYLKTTTWEEIQKDTDPYMTRKDNVRVVEFVLTASPEFFATADEQKLQTWKNENIEFLNNMFGKDNIKNLVLHRDERTPHMHAHITPIKDNKLNAKHFIGGKDKLRNLQDRYAKSMERFGLNRGIEGSKAKHERVQAYYARANAKEVQTLTLEKPSRLGNLDTYTRENQIKIDELNQTVQAKTQELERQKSLIESQKKALTKLSKQYESIERKKARLETERKNIEQERQKNIENEVRKAVEEAQKRLHEQTLVIEQEKASLTQKEAKINTLAYDVARKKIELEAMTNRQIISAAKDLNKNDHSLSIFKCLNLKNQGNTEEIIKDLKKLGCNPSQIKNVMSHSGLKIEIEKSNTISRGRHY